MYGLLIVVFSFSPYFRLISESTFNMYQSCVIILAAFTFICLPHHGQLFHIENHSDIGTTAQIDDREMKEASEASTLTTFHLTQVAMSIDPGTYLGVQNPISTVTLEEKQVTFLSKDSYNRVDASTTTMQNVSSDTSIFVQFSLVDYTVLPVLLAVGFFGNVMTIAVMHRAAYKTTPTSLILSLLSLADTSVLLMVPWNRMSIQKLIGLDVRGLHWLGCKLFFWAWRTAKMASAWFVVLISVERCIAIIYPLKARELITKRSAAYIVLIVFAVIFPYNGIRFAFSDVTRNGKCLAAIPENPENAALTKHLVVGGTTLSTYIPSVLVFFLNITSTYKLMRQSRKRQELTSAQGQQTRRQNRANKQLSTMLLGVSFAFQILVTPIAVLHILATLNNIPLFHTTDQRLVIAREVAMMLEQVNYSINFYLYVLCSQTFSKQFLILIGCSRLVPQRDSSQLYTLSDRTSCTSVSSHN